MVLNLPKILVGLDIFRKLLYDDDSHKNQGGIIRKTMTQNATKNDKREQCDTKHNALLKISSKCFEENNVAALDDSEKKVFTYFFF